MHAMSPSLIDFENYRQFDHEGYGKDKIRTITSSFTLGCTYPVLR